MLDHSEVRGLLRQRPPMLLLDTIRAFSPPASLVATKAITGAEDCYRDVEEGVDAAGFSYPAALLLESFGQAASVLWSLARLGPPEKIPLMVGIRDLTFVAPAVPGDVLEHRVRLHHQSGSLIEFTGETVVSGRVILTAGALLVVSRPPASLSRTTPNTVAKED